MALDAGTTSNRCILFNERGEMCSVAQKEFTQFLASMTSPVLARTVSTSPLSFSESQYSAVRRHARSL